MKFMTFNVRHDHGPNSTQQPFAYVPAPESFQGEQPWAIRKWKVADTVLLWSPDIEPDFHQVVDLESLLHEEYDWVGAGRRDGEKEGEFSPVFYKRDLLKVNSWKTLWLSEEPEVEGSLGWDARHPRIATVVEFESKSDGYQFTLFNAHFDHKGIEARRGAAELILKTARSMSHFVILMGDFNSPESDPGYQTLTGGGGEENRNDTMRHLEELNKAVTLDYATRTGKPVRSSPNTMTLPTHRVMRPGQIFQKFQNSEDNTNVLSDPVFLDTRYALMTRCSDGYDRKESYAKMSGPLGDYGTFSSFGKDDPDFPNEPRRLDYIMMMKHKGVSVRRYGVLPNKYDDGLYISDHRPVVVELAW
ncbi:Endonuclease/exonuclease/phosphatase [Dichotomocladium elegans]|nr:Endonuclease/exonuclease/phosphatase [Dichotomocladium elegans]